MSTKELTVLLVVPLLHPCHQNHAAARPAGPAVG